VVIDLLQYAIWESPSFAATHALGWTLLPATKINGSQLLQFGVFLLLARAILQSVEFLKCEIW
jgi:hypothetical protein